MSIHPEGKSCSDHSWSACSQRRYLQAGTHGVRGLAKGHFSGAGGGASSGPAGHIGAGGAYLHLIMTECLKLYIFGPLLNKCSSIFRSQKMPYQLYGVIWRLLTEES